jgi:gamma-glutamylcyclotransferase (GGCT)/AIG2-like uncharacterized protein YtfP
MHATELLFAYGTLQAKSVQVATFGRTLQGVADRLIGYRMEWLQISDPTVVENSGAPRHPIASYTGQPSDKVGGVVYVVSDKDLRDADTYEVAEYKRVHLTLASGRKAWVYVDARDGTVSKEQT